jgi:hypothetical protein
MTNEMERLLGDARTPSPPTELRDRTLRAALGAAERGRTPDRWAQIWHSRPLRYAWAATVVCLLLAHGLISAPRRSSPSEPQAFAIHQVSEFTEDEIRGLATFLRLDLEPRSLSDGLRVAAASGIATQPKAPNTKENIS